MMVLLTGEIHEYVNEMGSGCMTYMPSFMKIISGIQKLLKVSATHTDTQTAR
jgi:prolyl-tRNA synthetase